MAHSVLDLLSVDLKLLHMVCLQMASDAGITAV